jgi:hypothetical protein
MQRMWVMPRKAQGTWSTIVGLVVFLAIVVVVLMVLGPFGHWLKEASAEEVCKLSVIAKYGTKTAGLAGAESPVQIECYTQTYYAGQTELTKEDSKTLKTSQEEAYGRWTSQQKSEAIQRQMALAMHSCYDQFWEGKYNFYGEWGGEKEELRCVICSEFNFDKNLVGELKSAGIVDVSGRFDFAPFLAKEKINSTTSYKDYFNKGAALVLNPTLVVDTSQPMDIVFFTMTESRFDIITKSTAEGAGVGAGIGFLQPLPIPGTTVVGAGTGAVIGFFVGSAKAFFEGADHFSGVALAPAAGIPCRKLY